MKVSFYKIAEQEFDEAIAYYEQQLPGLGHQFRKAVKESIGRIVQFPDAYSIFSKKTRRCLVKRFPYRIIYKHSHDEIIVIAVAHLHRKPEYWLSRIR